MKRTLIVATLGIVAVGLLMGAAWGPGRFHRGMFRDPKKVDSFITWRITDALDDVSATPQQKQQILAIKDRLMPEVTRMMGERKAHHDEIKQLWLSGNVNQAEARAKIDQRIEEMRQMAYKVADGAIEAQKVLTPEQRAKLAERAEKMHEEGPAHE
ncbi:MAG: Spy/CpxP family protein refolding chaperone [Myxococcales bacterium]